MFQFSFLDYSTASKPVKKNLNKMWHQESNMATLEGNGASKPPWQSMRLYVF
jgi:hypothetical protein